MKKLLVLILLSLFLAPMPWGIAINPTSGQCTGYWGGDEYFQYDLPEGWDAYYPAGSYTIETPSGTCQWDTSDWDGRAQKCCQELGLSYLNEDLGSRHPTGYTLLILGVLACGGLFTLGILGLLAFGIFSLVWVVFRRISRPA
jgi:hypothetical protein